MSFGFSLTLHERGSSVAYSDLTRHVRNSWIRSSRHIGGYWAGECEMTRATMNTTEMMELYSTAIAKTIKEYTAGLLTWEGEVVAVELNLNGLLYRRTMDIEQFHNKVRVQYRHPVDEDSNQGVLAYNPGGHAAAFQDDAQDFSDWQSLAGTPDYMITVYNDDDSFAFGYCGPDFNTANPNDSIDVFVDHNDSRTAGWNGDVAAKTPLTYAISNVELRGSPRETAWTDDADAQASIDQFGYAEYIAVHGELTAEGALALRDRRLSRHLWPPSRTAGGLGITDQVSDEGATLRIICAGYVRSMNRRFYEDDLWANAISEQIAALVALSDHVSAGQIDANATLATVRGTEIPVRLWDAIDELIEEGDTSGNTYVGGVWNNRLFDYRQAASAVSYHWHGGKVTDPNGVPIWPTMIKPDRIIQIADQPLGMTPPDGNTWLVARNQYINAVEFIAPRFYRLYTGHELAMSAAGL